MKLLDAFRALPNRPRRVTVRELWLEHERWLGRRVATRGVVGIFEAGTRREYFVLDDGPDRIGLRGDPAQLRALAARPVRATGTLTFERGRGIFLVADEVRAEGGGW